jgi:hypothetical protein
MEVQQSLTKQVLPPAHYADLRLPDGSHSGVRVDALRGVIEIQRRGTKYYFDLTQIQDNLPVAIITNTCYDGGR